MEKTLKELDNTWSDMEFENELHTRTGLKLLKTNEELIETLEDNQVTCMYMYMYKYCRYTCAVHVHYTLLCSLFHIFFALIFFTQVQLQNMMTSKFVGYFLEQVSGWQKKLSNADAVITIWMEVQRTWSHLESIFIGSDDIRAQLPTHSKTFDTIDSDFKVHAVSYGRCWCLLFILRPFPSFTAP